MYIPAVLRPNEFASKPAAHYRKEEDEQQQHLHNQQSRLADSRRASIMSLAGLSSLGQKLARRATDENFDGAPAADADVELFPSVAGPVSRKHWKVGVEPCPPLRPSPFANSPPPTSPTARPLPATSRRACAPLATSTAGTTAASAATSFATRTRP
jgi:hypothetical protein